MIMDRKQVKTWKKGQSKYLKVLSTSALRARKIAKNFKSG
jgi:hypothetical protein